MENVIIIGAGGHAKSIASIIIACNDKIIGFLDDNIPIDTVILGKDLKIIGKISDINKFESIDTKFILGIGNNLIRKELYEIYPDLNYYTAIHPSVNIGVDTNIGLGTAIMANVCINSCTVIGNHCILNTACVIEHDNFIEDFVHICPGVILSGTVNIKKCTQIGAGAVVKNNIKINSYNMIGAGAVVVKDIEKTNNIYIGVPAKLKE